MLTAEGLASLRGAIDFDEYGFFPAQALVHLLDHIDGQAERIAALEAVVAKAREWKAAIDAREAVGHGLYGQALMRATEEPDQACYHAEMELLDAIDALDT